ncbi:MAG: carbon-nitrogen hydrolase family protein [Chloroflexi bacterium]|nr:carbon-nitrogen hydrolase family protein [Chloroflexota bacterium]
MKDKVVVAVVQMDVAWMDVAHNRLVMLERLRQATRSGEMDLVVFPELCNSGYVKPRDGGCAGRFVEAAEPIPGPTTEALGEAARELGVHIVAGLCEAHPAIPATMYNAAVMIGPCGEVLGVQHKLHLPSEEKHYFYQGASTEVFKTDLGNIGMMVCYDASFPELARVLALKGAEIICCVFAAPSKGAIELRRFEARAMTRAMENQVFFVACNRVGVQDDTVFSGHSIVTAPTSEILAQSGSQEEEVIFAVLEREVLVEARANRPIFRDRRPEMYGEVVRRP